jgi:2'-hydroxyisoflavone reductase
MKLLVLGGTRFLGRHLVEQALERGHDVTLLHRGRSHSGLFPQAAHLLADRDGDLSVLAGGRWDAAIDTSAYVPRQVHALGPVLGTRVGHYQLVSSISAYAGFNPGETDEDAPTATLDNPATQALTGATYGGLKALCEQGVPVSERLASGHRIFLTGSGGKQVRLRSGLKDLGPFLPRPVPALRVD